MTLFPDRMKAAGSCRRDCARIGAWNRMETGVVPRLPRGGECPADLGAGHSFDVPEPRSLQGQFNSVEDIQ